jgi:hypothetical protein
VGLAAKWGAVGGVLAVVTLFPAPLWATFGGWEYAEPLGWDAKDQKAFFIVHCVSETDRGPFVIYFDLKGVNPSHPVQVGWSKGGAHDEDSTFVSRLQALQRRLGPFVDVSGQTVFHYTWSVQQDSLISKDGYSRYARYRIRVSDQNMANEVFDVTTLCEPVVRMVRKYRVGETGPTFGILSFRAVPFEMCYETQVPVLLSDKPITAQTQPTKVEWIQWE